jgi:DNA-binding NarL/FixJ family response regulator
VKIVIADDHALYREGVKQLLRLRYPRIEFAEAADYTTLLRLLAEGKSDLILLDLKMPGSEGVQGLAKVCALRADVPVIVVSGIDDAAIETACLRTGASAFVSKGVNNETLLATIHRALGEPIARRRRINHDPTNREAHPPLTSAQLRLLALLVEGRSNKLIAEELHLTLGTVKQYVSQLLRHIGVDNRTQAALLGQQILQQRPPTAP